MRQIGIVALGVIFLFLGRMEAFSYPPVGLGIDQTTKEYGDYTQAVRKRIGDNMSKNLDGAQEGTVSLNFEIASDGKLIKVGINDDKTKASPKMISIAIMAVKQSAPFDPFPDPLSRNSKLPFNIDLSLKPANAKL